MRPVLPILFYAVGMILDVTTTQRALRAGRKEGNKFLRRLFGARPPLLLAIAWRAVVFAALVIWVPMPGYAWLLFGSLFYVVAFRNSRLVDASY